MSAFKKILLIVLFSLPVTIYAQESQNLNNSIFLDIGYRSTLYLGNAESKGIYTSLQLESIRKIKDHHKIKFGIQADLKFLGLFHNQIRINESYVNSISNNKNNLLNEDSLYQAAFIETVTNQTTKTAGNIFVSIAFTQSYNHIGNGSFATGLGIQSRSIRSNVTTLSVNQNNNDEPSNFYLNYSRNYFIQFSYFPLYSKKNHQNLSKRNILKRVKTIVTFEYADNSKVDFSERKVFNHFINFEPNLKYNFNVYLSLCIRLNP